jgi:His-Xaa-Ser system protein HxsD
MEESMLDNIEVHKDYANISVNPRLYPLSVIYSAAYWLLDRVHVIVDGDPDTEILIEIRPKKNSKNLDLKEIGYEFNDELINYSVYTVQATRNKKLREMIMQNSLAGNLKGIDFSDDKQYDKRTETRCDFQAQNSPKANEESAGCHSQELPIKSREQQEKILWMPGKGTEPNKIKIIRQRSQELQNKELLKGIESIDTDNISAVRDYRHTREEF